MQAAPPTDQASNPQERDLAIRAELNRILQSQSFRGSRRCCRFLEYSVQHVLAGNAQRNAQPNAQEDLRERSIGIEVFQRPPDYDTAEDAIVRVTANEVRKRLAQYYQESGAGSDPVITLPPGSYGVTIRWKPAPAVPPPVEVVPQRTYARGKWLLATGVALLAAVAVFLFVRAGRSEGERDPLWSHVFRPGQKTNIIMADAARYEIQELLARDLTLRDYLNSDYPNSLLQSVTPELQRVIRFMGVRRTTSVASVATGTRLLEFGRRLGGNPVLRHPRHINVREFNTDNFILLGSRLSIPWVELFEPWLNFPMVIDPETHQFYLENRTPRAGEPLRFWRGEDVTYADIAVLPNMEKSGTVVILNGIDMIAVEAAGEFALNGSLSSAVASSKMAAVEVLLRVKSIAETASKSEIVAIREVHPALGQAK